MRRLFQNQNSATLSFHFVAHFVEFPAALDFANATAGQDDQRQSNLRNPSTFSQNPNGIPQQSPGLRGTSYPGRKFESITTLKGLWPTAPEIASGRNPLTV